MKIGIDCRMYGLKHAGIGRYVESLVAELVKSKDRGLDFVLFVRKRDRKRLTIKPSNHLAIVEADFPHYSLREQVFMPFVLRRAKCDLVHFPHFNIPVFYFGPYVVTIHDLIKHESKGTATTTKSPVFYWLKYLGYLLVVWLAVKRAKKIIVPSEWVKKKVIKQFRLEPDKVIVVYEGIGENFRGRRSEVGGQRSEVLGKYNIKKPYLLYVGSVYPHKNIERLIEATKTVCSNYPNSNLINSNKFEKNSNNSSISLVIVCSRSVFWERLKKKIVQMDAKDFVNLAGFVPDEDLPFLYQNAEAFVFPSLSEGFGLPGLEAMASGCPVVCSEIPVFREVYGEAAVYFNPHDASDITQKILEVLRYNDTYHFKMVARGRKQAERFSWEKCAKETLRVYDSLMVSNGSRIDSNVKIVLPNLSYRIMGALFNVHNELGPSLLEKYYQRGIDEELKRSGLRFKREVPIEICYKDESIGRYFLDFVIEDLVILEAKAQRYYTPKFFKQALAYLKQTNLPLAIIVNFRGNKLRYKRIVNPSFKNVDLSSRDIRIRDH